jgi:hypothetical protein
MLPVQARKAYWRSGVEAPYNLHIGISLKTVVTSTYLPLYPGEAAPRKHLFVSLVGTRKSPHVSEKREIFNLYLY